MKHQLSTARNDKEGDVAVRNLSAHHGCSDRRPRIATLGLGRRNGQPPKRPPAGFERPSLSELLDGPHVSVTANVQAKSSSSTLGEQSTSR